MVDDVCCTWRSLNHRQGVEGHQRAGLSLSLTREDDHRITREAKTFWDEAGIVEWRAQEVQRIEDLVKKGELRWSKEDISKLLQPFDASAGGIGPVEREGQELEAAQPRDSAGIVGDAPWSAGKQLGESGGVMSSDDEAEAGDATAHFIGVVEVPAKPTDTGPMIACAIRPHQAPENGIPGRRGRSFSVSSLLGAEGGTGAPQVGGEAQGAFGAKESG